jgi:hypothetical protein
MSSHGKILPFVFLVPFALQIVPPAVGQPSGSGSGPFSSDAEFPPNFPTPSEARSVHPPPSLAVFFPPAAPVYGAPLTNPNVRTFINGRKVEPPDDLGKYVGEFFYPPLSTRLLTQRLDTKLAQRLAAYLARHTALLNELQNTLVVLQAADPPTRERELHAFAAVQTPQIVAHEKEAEELRQKLIQGGLLGSSVDWSKDRDWKLGDAVSIRPASAASAELQVIRAAAYYQNGLTPEQRGLLCEIVEKERRSPVANRLRGSGANMDPRVVFFSPDMARLRLPDDLPQELSAKIADLTRGKDELKEELRRAVVENDRSSEAKRGDVFRKLAESEWPRIAALASLAEEIRRELATLPAPPPPPPSPQIPAPLAARMEAYKQGQAALNGERLRRASEVSRGPLFLKLELPDKMGVGGPASRTAQLSDRLAQRRIELQETDEAYMRENADRYRMLEEDSKKLSADLQQFAKSHLDPVTGDPMDIKILFARVNATERYLDQVAREEVLYKHYRVAMLEPGLSPEQRRLLFNAARVELAQVLPSAEMFPRGRIPFPFL